MAVVAFAAVFSASLIVPTAAWTGVLSTRLVVALAHFRTAMVLWPGCAVGLTTTTIAAIILTRHGAIHVARARMRHIAIHPAITRAILRVRARRPHVTSAEFVGTRGSGDLRTSV